MRRLLNRPATTLLAARRLAAVLVVLTATPAFSQTVSQHKPKLWHYWIAPVLLISFVLMSIGLAIGYYVRVVRVPRR